MTEREKALREEPMNPTGPCKKCKGKTHVVHPGVFDDFVACDDPDCGWQEGDEVEDEKGELIYALSWITKYARNQMEKNGPPNWVEFENVIVECESVLKKYESTLN